MSRNNLNDKLDEMLHNFYKRDVKNFSFNVDKVTPKKSLSKNVASTFDKIIYLTGKLFKNQKWASGVSLIIGVVLLIGTVSMFSSLSLQEGLIPFSPYAVSQSENDKSNLSGSMVPSSQHQSDSTADTNSSDNSYPESSETDIEEKTPATPAVSKIPTPTPTPVLSNTVTIEKINQNKALPKFKSYQDILDLLKKMDLYNHPYYRDEAMQDGDVSAPGAPAGTPSASKEYSDTNVQVEGIAEGDIIKNDGEYLYISNINYLSIVKAYPVEKMGQVSKITLPEYESISELYVKGNLLTIIISSYLQKPMMTKSETDTGVILERVWTYYKQSTIVRVYDITSKEKPLLKREIALDGYLVSSREKDGNFYVITSSYIYDYYLDELKEEEVLPGYTDSVIGKTPQIIKPEEILYCPENISANYLLISTFNINTNDQVNIETILGAGNTVYMSHNALYIIQPFYKYSVIQPFDETNGSNSLPDDMVIMPSHKEGTIILKFLLTGKSVKFDVAGEVPGQILNQYSLDEFNNNLRIATTSRNANWEPSNNLYVLDNTLKVIGKIENLAPTERIYAVRFMGKTGYIVTFRDIDPLFVIDLSSPANPKVTGELKIPGFSNYLHPVSDTLLLGIGSHIVDNRTAGIKVSLFDVSNPFKPAEIDFMVFGGTGSSSQVQYNPRAFVWWKTKSMALFPVYLSGEDGSSEYSDYKYIKSGAIALTIEDKKIVELSRLVPEISEYGYYNQSRVVYIDKVVYLSMNNILYAYDAVSFIQIANCPF